MKLCNILLITALASSGVMAADDEPVENTGLQSHELNTLSYTFDDNDVSYLDFKVSLKYPLYTSHLLDKSNQGNEVFFALTMRLGQYINTRRSSPVIGKRFNPTLFLRHWFDRNPTDEDQSYIDLIYGHESNGQSITELTRYNNLREAYRDDEGHAEFANDYITRGWDYIGVDWKRAELFKNVNTLFGLKYFLPTGVLQGGAEDIFNWEPGYRPIKRRHVDGLSLTTEYASEKKTGALKLRAIYHTGYDNPLKFNSLRLEASYKLKPGDWYQWLTAVPMMIWVSSGYNSDFTDLHQRVNSIGIGFEFKSALF